MSHPNSDKGDVEAKQELAGYIEYWIDCWDNFEYEHYDEFVEEHNRIWSNYFDLEIDGNLLSDPADWRVDNSDFFQLVMSCLHEENIDSTVIWKFLRIFSSLWESLVTRHPWLPHFVFTLDPLRYNQYPYCLLIEDSVNDDDLYKLIDYRSALEGKDEIFWDFEGSEVTIYVNHEDISDLCIDTRVKEIAHTDYTDACLIQVYFDPEPFNDIDDEAFFGIANVEYSYEKDEFGNWKKGKIESLSINGYIEDVKQITSSLVLYFGHVTVLK